MTVAIPKILCLDLKTYISFDPFSASSEMRYGESTGNEINYNSYMEQKLISLYDVGLSDEAA